MFGPVIEGEHVRLEPPRLECSALFQRWLADMNVTRYLAHRHPPSQRQEEGFLEDAAADANRVLWGIALRDGPEPGRLIGATVLEKIDWRNRDAESGIMIGDTSELAPFCPREPLISFPFLRLPSLRSPIASRGKPRLIESGS